MPSFSLRQSLSDLRFGRLNSALARRLLTLVYREGNVYTVPFGQLRGVKLQYDPTINFHAMLGLWETESFDLLTRILNAGILPDEAPMLCDVGANAGIYSLFLAKQRPTGTIYAFEPAPVVERLRTNLGLNHVVNVNVVQRACSDKVGEEEFYLGYHHHASSLHADWAMGRQDHVQTIRVSTTTLDDYFFGAQARPSPDFIKIDIEGGGTLALKGCDRCIQDKRPLFLIESHTPDEDRAISNLVLKHDYQAFRLDNHRWVSALDQTHPNPDGVWGTLLLWPAEKRSQAEKVLGS